MKARILFIIGFAIACINAHTFTDDLFLDFVWREIANGYNYVWEMRDNQKTTNSYALDTVPISWAIVGSDDFNRDGFIDLLWREEASGANAIWFMGQPDGRAHIDSSNLPYSTGWRVVGVGDFNADGHPDILWNSTSVTTNYVWLMTGPKGDQQLSIAPLTSPNPPGWTAVGTGDFDNDGYWDIVWRDNVTGYVSIWLMNGLSQASTSYIDVNPGSDYKLALTGPCTRFGNTDIVWRSTLNDMPIIIWRMCGARYTGSQNIVENVPPYDTVTVDQNWTLTPASGGYGQRRAVSARVSDQTNLLLTWRYGEHLKATMPVTAIYRREYTPDAWYTNGVWEPALVTDYWPYRLTNAVMTGKRYDYAIAYFQRSTNANTGEVTHTSAVTNFISAGIRVPTNRNRGRVLLLVDSVLIANTGLATDLEVFKKDLISDGWSVQQNNVPRYNDALGAGTCDWTVNSNSVATIKAITTTFYTESTNSNNHILILGHVAVPYSGNDSPPDNHTDHRGGWPMDAYYGDVIRDTPDTWSDSNTIVNTSFPKSYNCPNDGRFDGSFHISLPEMPVGRVDFFDLVEFFKSGEDAYTFEARLLRQYFEKNRNYRYNLPPYPVPNTLIGRQAFAPTTFGVINTSTITAAAVQIASRCFSEGVAAITEGDYFVCAPTNYMFGLISGDGRPWSVQRDVDIATSQALFGTASLLNSNPPPVAFYFAHGSYFSDFNSHTNALLSSHLATPTYGLAIFGDSSGSGPEWRLDNLAMGDTLGQVMLHHVWSEEYPVYVSAVFPLLGDPTLRFGITHTPRDPAWTNGTLSWMRSLDDSGDVSYGVEVASDLYGTWSLLTSTTGTSVSDNSPPPRWYRVRAEKLVVTGSGSFLNLSQGVFVERK